MARLADWSECEFVHSNAREDRKRLRPPASGQEIFPQAAVDGTNGHAAPALRSAALRSRVGEGSHRPADADPGDDGWIQFSS